MKNNFCTASGLDIRVELLLYHLVPPSFMCGIPLFGLMKIRTSVTLNTAHRIDSVIK